MLRRNPTLNSTRSSHAHSDAPFFVAFNAPFNWREQTAEERDYSSRRWRNLTPSGKQKHLREAAAAAEEDAQVYSLLDICREGRLEDLKQLFEAESSAEGLDLSTHAPRSNRVALLGDGSTPLTVAVLNNRYNIVTFLLDHGADPEGRWRTVQIFASDFDQTNRVPHTPQCCHQAEITTNLPPCCWHRD